MLEYTCCAVCGSNSYRIINTCQITEEDADILERSLDIVKCSGCDLLFVNPQPKLSQEHLQKLYGREYFNKGYMKFYYTNSQAHSFQSNEAFIYRLDFIEKYKKTGRILDIGCASGSFLNLAKQKGWDVSGVELSDYAAKFAIEKYNLNIFRGSFEESKFPDNYFQVVCASDIIEHLNNPHDFLAKIYQVLSNDGLLYLAFPNANSFYYKLFGFLAHYNHRNYFLLPYHLCHFSPSSIRLLLKKTGFSVLKLRYSHSRSNLFFMNIFNFRDRVVLIARKE